MLEDKVMTNKINLQDSSCVKVRFLDLKFELTKERE